MLLIQKLGLQPTIDKLYWRETNYKIRPSFSKRQAAELMGPMKRVPLIFILLRLLSLLCNMQIM